MSEGNAENPGKPAGPPPYDPFAFSWSNLIAKPDGPSRMGAGLCHRAVENRPPAGTSKPATPRSFIHIRFLGAGKGLSISHICWRDHS
jgi:hypothetical protein